ncbi:MAG: beta-galactosidase [Muribaculaceae bacterium]|nr:beta-galactosidase [Muribaculaceae bacterium]
MLHLIEMRQRILTLLLLVFGFMMLFAEKYQSGSNHPFINPTPGEITIMACTPIPHGLKSTRKDYEDLIECGFNLGTEALSMDQYEREFEIIGDLDFKYMIYSSFFFSDKMNEVVKRFQNNPYVGGWSFKDEPNYADLKKVKFYYDKLYESGGSKLIFMNLLGGLSSKGTGPAKSYLDYLKVIQKNFKPEVWSFDLYPVFLRNGKIDIAYDIFFEDLEAMHAMSKMTDRPFWFFCQSMAFRVPAFERPAATEAYLRFANFSALAYGAQGILYWTYGMRNSNESETYLSALVNLDGKKTPAWYAAKKVNAEIKKFNDIFYQSNILEVKHTGSKVYRTTKKLSGKFGPFKKISSSKAGVLLSRIENNGKNYIMIVNHDPLAKQKVMLKLADGKRVIDMTNNNREYGSDDYFSILLDKGGYAIFREI